MYVSARRLVVTFMLTIPAVLSVWVFQAFIGFPEFVAHAASIVAGWAIGSWVMEGGC